MRKILSGRYILLTHRLMLPNRFPSALLALSVCLLVSCGPNQRAEIPAVKEETERISEEQRTISGETAALVSQLDVLGKSAGRVEDATTKLGARNIQLKRKLAGLEAASQSIKEQTDALKAEHEAFRKKNALN